MYDLQDSAFVKEIDKEILKNNELRHYTKHHARALMKTEFSENRYQRYGVS